MKAIVPIVSLIILVSGLSFGLGCGSQPTPTTTTPSQPSPTATAPAPSSTATAKPGALAQIIEAAKKEGSLTVSLSSSHTPAPVVARMKKEIKDKYGVDLDLKVTGTSGMAQLLATAIMEQKTGNKPTYDAYYMGNDDEVYGQKEGIFEIVDWKSLLEAGTIAEVMPKSPEFSAGLVMWSGMTGLMYNPNKVKAGEMPKTLSDLGDPKWMNRIGILNYPDYYARWAFLLGKDKTKSNLQAIMKNKPFVQLMPALNNRFALGEIDIALISATYLLTNKEKGAPAAWQALDFCDARDFMIMVAKGAQHPNAAKLFAIYMVSPEGFKLNADVGKGNRFYPGSLEYEMTSKAKETNTFYTLDNRPDLLKFTLSPEYDKLVEEFTLMLKGQ